LFVLGASGYILYRISGDLETVGGKLGRLLRLPSDVVAATFQALATSGPEIMMAILAASPYIAQEIWQGVELAEKASSGALNMCFSAMDNLLGIGCLGIIFMLYKGTMDRDEVIRIKPSARIALLFYIVSSLALSWFLTNDLVLGEGSSRVSVITEAEAWVLAGLGILFLLFQLFYPVLGKQPASEDDIETAQLEPLPPPGIVGWTRSFLGNLFAYAALVFALVIFVRWCMWSTFNMATVGWFSVGGILIMFTSYISSLPEFMLTYRFAVKRNKDMLLSMLFGSNVIDLAFSGFRPIWLHEPMEVYTTGRFPQLLPLYIWCLPLLALLALLGLWTGAMKARHAYPLAIFYVIYIVSGWILL
jgi:Ca2+/Na+ antiporter